MKGKGNDYAIGKGNKFSSAVGRFIYKLPYGIIVVMVTIAMIAMGYLTAKYNAVVSQIVTTGYTADFFKGLVMLNVLILLSDRTRQISMKSLSMKKINKDYVSMLEICLNSKVHNINYITTGKISDTARNICMLKSRHIEYLFQALPCLIPYGALIIKEFQYNWICAMVSILALVISSLIMIFNEKIFGWEKNAKQVKSDLQSVSVDNLLNVSTFKYIHEMMYPIRRLIKAQEKAFPFEINVAKMGSYGVSLIAMWLPALINTYLCRADISMVAYILLSDYVIQNMSHQTTAIFDNKIELNASEKVIEELKADDVEQAEVFTGKMDLSGLQFKHRVREDETIYNKETVKETVFTCEDVVIESGKRYLIKGKSGSGKSSFLAMMAGGLEILNDTSLKRYLSYYIWQETSLFNDTLVNNIIPDEIPGTDSYNEKMKLIDEYATKLGMRKLIDHELPEGWQTRAGERGYRFSSGEKQRVNIIRALLAMKYHPEYIFLLDEITSNLDGDTKDKAISLIDEVCHSTLIVVSHNAGFENYVDQEIRVTDHNIRMVNKKQSKQEKKIKVS